MFNKQHIQRLKERIETIERRLHELQKSADYKGAETPIQVILEIEDRQEDLALIKAELKKCIDRTFQARVLVVDDNEAHNERYYRILRSSGFVVSQAYRVEEAKRKLEEQLFEVVLLDMELPADNQHSGYMGGFELLDEIIHLYPTTMVIVLTVHPNIAGDAISRGACNFLNKGPDIDYLLADTLKTAGWESRIRQARRRLAEERDNPETGASGEMVTMSPALKSACLQANTWASITDVAVVIFGATGVGKKMLARHIHNQSSMYDGPLVDISCKNLKGSFDQLWGTREKPGYCTLASGGTLVITDLQDIPLSSQEQAKLLTLLRRQTFTPVDSQKPITSECRVLFTLTGSLKDLLEQRQLITRLSEQLHVAPIYVPTLLERNDPNELMAIAGSLMRRYTTATMIAEDARAVLTRFPFAEGNIVELKARLLAAAETTIDGIIRARDLPLIP